MSRGDKKLEHIRLERYLAKHFHFQLNEITGSIEFKKQYETVWEELNEFNIYRQLKLEGFTINLNELIYLLKSDYVNRFNPFVNYFESLPVWKNDPDYIRQLCSFVQVKHPARFEKHFKKWLVRTIRCALEDSYCNKHALILVHEMQNSGKTTFIRFLCPEALKNYMTENISFDKDSLIALVENFIINLDELATFTRVEINALKSIMSKSFVKERHPFERKAKKLPRRVSFIGSTNMTEFLSDPTGNVRWIPFEISGIDWNYSSQVNIDEVWAQAYSLYKSGYSGDITAEEVRENEEENKQFTLVSPEMELLLKYYEPGTREKHDLFLTTGEIEIALRKETDGLAKISANQLGKALRMTGFSRDNRYSKGKEYPIKAYFLKFREEK
ncbi:VapE family protein [Ferruginibacter paludis]|uniref:VapE domain-containing protein n=1 Tax=Ferruginibacter paludis TaxID=1310417 RepID=UPI0025B487B9|nr:VapE domain-containing protein [Ferruginibacter paludis]MDN3657072.1 VapE family protein [Ferruginibacter paludis]